MVTPPAAPDARRVLRERLLGERERWVGAHPQAAAALAARLREVLQELDPDLLGLYWPVRSEFNASVLLADDEKPVARRLALPFATRRPPAMHYRPWDGRPPTLHDECGIPSCAGAEVVPEVVLVPCVGFTPEGFRLGYGGGYFDRWLAAHPGVTTVGVAWSGAALDAAAFDARPHDRPLDLVVTEAGVLP